VNRPRTPRRVDQILDADSQLAQLAAQARTLLALQKALDAALPSVLTGHWQLASVDRKQMVVVAETSIWATRLRFHEPALLEALSKQGLPRSERIRIRVARLSPEPAPVTPPKRQLPTAAISALEAAERQAGSGALGDALRSMLTRHRSAAGEHAQDTAETGTD
jgi:hypothetical protein